MGASTMGFLKNPLNFIKKANRTFNLYLENYKKIDAFLNTYNKDEEKMNRSLKVYARNQKKMESLFSAFLDLYVENQEKLDGLKNTLDTLKGNYTSSKKYFYKGEEQLFKMMDTDDFFQMCHFNNIKLISHSPAENKIYLKTEDGLILATNNHYHTVREIFTRGVYNIPQLHQFKEFVVFDIGMNRGYAALKFSNFDSCKAVYGFEINDETYNLALENFNLNPSLNHKITPYNYGLSNQDEDVDIYYLPGSDGVTNTELEFTNLQSEWLRGKEQLKTKKAKVKEAGSVISHILEKENITSNIVIKIDTEGSEHKILDNLILEGVMDKVDLIMGEVHLQSVDLDEKLVNFINIYKKFHSDTICSFAYTKPEFYQELTLRDF